jgi:hypothetical protein
MNKRNTKGAIEKYPSVGVFGTSKKTSQVISHLFQ